MIEQKFMFAGVDLLQWVYVTSVNKKLAPQRSFTQTTIQGRNGVLVSSSRLESFEIEVQVMFKQKDEVAIESARTYLASILLADSEQELVLPYMSGYYRAIYTGDADLSRLWQYPAATLTFTVTDPVAYGQERTETLTTTQKLIRVGGNYAAKPVITVTAANASYLQVTNVTTGKFIRVESNLSSGAKVIIDTENEYCTVGGSYVPVTLASTFFAISGTPQLYLSSGSATITWNERWL